MAPCEVCGNEYDKTFEIHRGGAAHVFDSLECAIHALAPVCKHCGCRVVGHGVEAKSRIFCCAHCAAEAGVAGLADRAGKSARETSGHSGRTVCALEAMA